MGRPKGTVLSQDTRDRIRASNQQTWAQRRPWIEASKQILNAANAGDHEMANDLLWEFYEQRAAEYAPDPGQVLNTSQADRQAAITEMKQELEDLFSETRRLWAERDTQAAITEADIEAFRKMLLRDLKAVLALRAELRGYREPGPYDGIPSPATRAAERRVRLSELDSR